MTRKDYLYQYNTWPELGQVAKRQPVVVLPVGSVEDHGPHLPLDVDNFLIWSICEAAAQQAEGDILLMPIIPFGLVPTPIDAENLVASVRRVARQGKLVGAN